MVTTCFSPTGKSAAAHAFALGPDVAAVGVAEVHDAAAVVEHDLGSVDVEEGAGVGDHAQHVGIAVNPDFSLAGFVLAGGFAPCPEHLAFAHSVADVAAGGFGG